MSWRRQQIEPVDATNMHEWEADTPSQIGAALLFWCWYLPAEMIGWRRAPRAIPTLIRGRELLRYPLVTAPARRVAVRNPVRTR